MALSVVRRVVLPLRARLVAQRAALVGGVSLAGAAAAWFALGAGPARSRYFTAHQRLSWVDLGRLAAALSEGAGWLAVLSAIGLLVLLVVEVVHSAGALAVLAARRGEASTGPAVGTGAAPARGRFAPTLAVVLRAGAPHLGAFLGLLVLALSLDGAGLAITSRLLAWARRTVTRAHGSMDAVLLLAVARAVVALLFAALVGAFVHAARAITVLDGRRCLRRTSLLALGALVRRPLAVLGFVLVTGAAQVVLGAAFIVPDMLDSITLRITMRTICIILILLGQGLLWLVLLEASLAILAAPDLRARRAPCPDAPPRPLRAALRWLVARLRRGPPPPLDPAVPGAVQSSSVNPPADGS